MGDRWRIRRRKTIHTRLHRVYFYLWDHMYDRLPPAAPDWWWDVLHRLVERPGLWVLCKVYGHEPMPDQCGRPEHDFCVWCGRVMPHARSRQAHDRG